MSLAFEWQAPGFPAIPCAVLERADQPAWLDEHAYWTAEAEDGLEGYGVAQAHHLFILPNAPERSAS